MYYLLVHGLVIFRIFISLLLLGLDDVQEGEEMVFALPLDLLPPDIFKKILGMRLSKFLSKLLDNPKTFKLG